LKTIPARSRSWNGALSQKNGISTLGLAGGDGTEQLQDPEGDLAVSGRAKSLVAGRVKLPT
jgi:hypothetical protein